MPAAWEQATLSGTVRTADGRYAKLEILGYYCPGAHPGCLTFRYVFQGDGTPLVGAPA